MSFKITAKERQMILKRRNQKSSKTQAGLGEMELRRFSKSFRKVLGPFIADTFGSPLNVEPEDMADITYIALRDLYITFKRDGIKELLQIIKEYRTDVRF